MQRDSQRTSNAMHLTVCVCLPSDKIGRIQTHRAHIHQLAIYHSRSISFYVSSPLFVFSLHIHAQHSIVLNSAIS